MGDLVSILWHLCDVVGNLSIATSTVQMHNEVRRTLRF